MRNLGPMFIYESTDAFTEGVERCFDVGITEFILGYPNVDEQIPVFDQIARNVIPELREKYSK
jgi:hypothetical protein